MDHTAVLALFDREMREHARPFGPDSVVERVGGVVRHVGSEQGWNGVLWSDLTESDADAAIAEQCRYFARLGREFEWKLYGHDRPHDLGQRLLAAGFTPEPAETLMVIEAGELDLDAGPPPGVELRPVTDAAGVGLMADVHEQAFGTPGTGLRHQLLAQLDEAPDTLVAVVAVADGVPVSSARMELVPGTQFAGLWGGGTVEAWRGRGIYRALIAHRARVAVDRGYPYLQVDASDQSRPILRRLGFAPLTTTVPYVHAAP
ncbi:N-acetyltransferase [Streptomyces tauricus]|uniref:GNAT family N-acetyltransferase n=1 Tax=Streptomyces tauricus TaxID=68274 RepID=A0ABZ1JW07_9ACTN|nr:GNAT family N-acetyltransferase [Streptomyces tauricus]MCW8096524.1 GNAT family N-acetyltransferase [Streptomyces tauricus]GHA49270.1 N-acetyltransferase [Streptomyces tauricus]